MRESGNCRPTDGASPPLSLRSEEKTGDGPTELTRREGRSCFITTCPLYTAAAHFGETDGRAHYETDSQREFGTFRGLRKGKERDGRWKEEWRLPFWKERKEFLPCPTSLSAAVCIRRSFAANVATWIGLEAAAAAATILELFTILPNHHHRHHQQLNTHAAAAATAPCSCNSLRWRARLVPPDLWRLICLGIFHAIDPYVPYAQKKPKKESDNDYLALSIVKMFQKLGMLPETTQFGWPSRPSLSLSLHSENDRARRQSRA